MATGSRHKLSQVLEASFAVTPVTPIFEEIRHTTCTLGITKAALTSEELRQDRQIATYRQGAPEAGGDIGTEVSMDSHDTAIEAVLLGTWAAEATVTASTISFTAPATIADSGGGLPVISAGESVKITSGLNTGIYTVVTSDVNTMVVVEAIVDEVAGSPFTVETYKATVKAGVLRRSFTFERQFTDLGPTAKPFHFFVGCEYNTLAMTLAPNAIAGIDYGIVGYNGSVSEVETAGSTYIPKTTTDVIDTFTGSIFEDGVRLCVVTEVTLNLDNGIARRFVIGELDCPDPIQNSIEQSNLTGQIVAYFENSYLLEKFLDSEASSLVFNVGDGSREYEFNIPRLFYTGGQPDVTGPGDITITLPFQAVYDPTQDSNIAITRQNVTP